MDDIIKIFALGGLDENGKNMYCFDINDEIYIIEVGLKYPEVQNLGIDIEIPSFEYLINNKERVKGIFITHAHPDAMGAISYLLKEINVPIYATHLTSWIIEDRLKENNIKNYTIKRIKDNSIVKLNEELKVHTFKTTHSIIQSIGLAFQTKYGFLVFTSDYIIDFGSTNEYQTDIHKIVEIAKKGVLVLMTESIGALKTGHTSPKHKIFNKVQPIILQAKGRIIATVYTHSLYNIKEICEVSTQLGYRIIFLDKEMQDLVHKHEKLNAPIVAREKIAPISDIDKNDVLVIISGNGASVFEQLSAIATNEDDILKPNKNDTFIIASPLIPGIENIAIKAIDDVYRLDSDVYTFSSKNLASMHAAQEDLKMMINLFNPKYYLPVKGNYTQMVANANTAVEMGIDKNNCIILENGQISTITNGVLHNDSEFIKVGSNFIAGQTINENNGVVLNDRLSLSQDGTIIIGVGLDKKTKKIASSIDVQTRGFVYIKDSEYLIDEIRNITTNLIESFSLNNEQDYNEVKSRIRDSISKYIYKETKKRPIILSMIISF